jgi:hypothetical protein
MGTPCVNVPAHVAGGNLPVGVQIIADYGDDAKALAGARFKGVGRRALPGDRAKSLAHDPEKCAAVFRKDHAQTRI